MTFWIAFLVIVILYVLVAMPGWGKFWHKHDWQEYAYIESPSIYSKKKINIHHAIKCANCTAFKVDTYTVKKEDERV